MNRLKRFSFCSRASRTRLALHLCVGTFLAAPAQAQTVINNPGNDGYSQWGIIDTATYGQTVTAPTGSTLLLNFTFTIANYVNGYALIPFRAYVYNWDSTNFKATGNALFTSDTLVANANTAYTLTTTGTAVTAGNQYVLFFSTSGVGSTTPAGHYAWFYNRSDSYTGGQFVYINNGEQLSEVTARSWQTASVGDNGGDLRFTATFNGAAAAAPDPATLPLSGLGLTTGTTMTGAVRRRKTAKNTTTL